jgi:pimeloyl-ACP methyl ester carboxylesterase
VRIEGGCHCGNLTLAIDTALAHDAIMPSACDCTFCRSHDAKCWSDPVGSARITVRDESLLQRYRFGLETADFLVCRRCGTYAGAAIDEGATMRATLNLRLTSLHDLPAKPVSYASETRDSRIARRRERWTPAALVTGVARMSEVLDLAGVRLELVVRGDGEPVLLLPSLGRSASDFDELMNALADAGFRAIALNPRGIGASDGPLHGITLHDLAADAARVLHARANGRAHVVGHAFGHRIACCLAVDHPGCVNRLVLLGAGGLVAPDPAARTAFKRFLTETLTTAERYEAIRTANFAPDSDASPWMDGWWTDVAHAQIEAARLSPSEQWWDGGAAQLLVVQGLDDKMAPPENGRMLASRLGSRVQLVEIPDAGHALLPEQPRRVAAAIIEFLSSEASRTPAVL